MIRTITTIAAVFVAIGATASHAQGATEIVRRSADRPPPVATQPDSLKLMLDTQSDRVDRILAAINESRASRDAILRDMREHLGFLRSLAPDLIQMNDLLSKKAKTPSDWRELVSLMDSTSVALDATRAAWEPNAVRLEHEVTQLEGVWGKVINYANDIVASAQSRLGAANKEILNSGDQLRALDRSAAQASPACQLDQKPASCPLDVRRKAMDIQNRQLEARDEAQIIQQLLPGLQSAVQQINQIYPRLQDQELRLVTARHQLARVENRLEVMIRETRPILNFNSIIDNYAGLEKEVDQFTAAFNELQQEFDALPAVTFSMQPEGDDLYATVEREAQGIRNSIAYADSMRAGLDSAHAVGAQPGQEAGGQ